MADTAAPVSGKRQTVKAEKPENPDENSYKTGLAEREAQHAVAQEKLKSLNAKIDLATSNNKDSPVAQRQQELYNELSELRKKQQLSKSSRLNVIEQIKKMDEQLKSRIQENKAVRSRVQYRNIGEIDAEIARLQKQVDSSTMKIVDENKALAAISALNRQKKSFAGFEQADKGIADLKARVAELRKGLDDPEAKAVSERSATVQGEIDAMRAEQDNAFKTLNTLRDERAAARAEQQARWNDIKEFKDRYFDQKRAFNKYKQEAYKANRERQAAERKAYESQKRREVADAKLEEASAPAYAEEIVAAEGLIRYFDPSALPAKETSNGSRFAAQATRTTDDSAFRGMKLVKKNEEDYFAGSSGKRGRKGRKNRDISAAASGFNMSMGIIEQLAQLNVDAPASQDDVRSVVERLKEKVDFWKRDQDRMTQENIAKVKKEIAKLEAAEVGGHDISSVKDTAREPVAKVQQANGSTDANIERAQNLNGETHAVEKLTDASIVTTEHVTTA